MLYDKKWDKPTVLQPHKQLLLDAAQYIRDHGWHQSSTANSVGGVCIMGALFKVVDCSIDAGEALAHLNKYLGFEVDHYLVIWNDQPKRTKEEIIAVLEGAARS